MERGVESENTSRWWETVIWTAESYRCQIRKAESDNVRLAMQSLEETKIVNPDMAATKHNMTYR